MQLLKNKNPQIIHCSLKSIVNSFLSIVLLLSLYGCSTIMPTSEEDIALINKAKQAKFIVLDVYHHDCESCRYIEPVFKKVQEYYSNNSKVVFLKYDLSNSFAALKSRNTAKELGLDDIYKSQRYSGIVLLINNSNKAIIESFVAEYSYDKYIESINRKLNGP